MNVRLGTLRKAISERLSATSDLETVVANQPDSLQRIANQLASGVRSGDADVSVASSNIVIYPEGAMGPSIILKSNGTWRYVK